MLSSQVPHSLAGVAVRGADEEPPSSSAGRGATAGAGDDAAAGSGRGVAGSVRRGESSVQPVFPHGHIGAGHVTSSERRPLSLRTGDLSPHLRGHQPRDAAAGMAQRGGGGPPLAPRRAQARLPAVCGMLMVHPSLPATPQRGGRKRIPPGPPAQVHRPSARRGRGRGDRVSRGGRQSSV